MAQEIDFGKPHWNNPYGWVCTPPILYGEPPVTSKSTTDIDRAVGVRITALRKANGLTQTALGQALGVTFQQVQKYERGTNRVSGGRLQQLAQILKVPMSALFGEDEPEHQSEIFAFLTETSALELLRAYASIHNDDIRRNILAIVHSAAQISIGPVEGTA